MTQTDADNERVFRDVIERHRGKYYVEYKPAIWCNPLAIVDLTFSQPIADVEIVRDAMEQELEYWLNQYPAPAMVTAWDAKEDIVHVSSNDDELHLFGYVNQHTGQIVRYWKLPSSNELPPEQMNEKYFSLVYEGLPFRRQVDVQRKALHEAVITGRAIRFIVLLVVGVPLLIQIVSLGIDWIGYVLSGISISVGLYKLCKSMGWIRLGKREILEAEKNNKMRHYYYHCEKNPEAFNRLKIENFEREAIERTHREAEGILKDTNRESKDA
jgi:hypothetical protein